MPENESYDFTIQNWLPVLATAYGEAASEPYDDKLHVLSSMLNRSESGKAEFGADTGKITDVLQRGYYAYSKQSPKFKEAMSMKFPDKESEDSFKEFVAILSGMLKGRVQRTSSEFFFTSDEIKSLKKGGNFNFDLLEQVGEGKTWKYFRYKPAGTGKPVKKKK